jgi:molecular chaperone GrpE
MTEESQAASTEQQLSDAVEEVLSEAATLTDEAASLKNDLQRLQAEYSNYRKRVDRDRALAADLATALFLTELLPILDDLDRAGQHGELVGGFKAVADRITTTCEKLGLVKFGNPGEPFDPNIHEALTHNKSSDVTEPTATEVLQPGYKLKDKVLRPARVAVTEPS